MNSCQLKYKLHLHTHQSQAASHKSSLNIRTMSDPVIARAETGSRLNVVSEGRERRGCLGTQYVRMQYTQAAEASSHEEASIAAGVPARKRCDRPNGRGETAASMIQNGELSGKVGLGPGQARHRGRSRMPLERTRPAL